MSEDQAEHHDERVCSSLSCNLVMLALVSNDGTMKVESLASFLSSSPAICIFFLSLFPGRPGEEKKLCLWFRFAHSSSPLISSNFICVMVMAEEKEGDDQASS